MTGSFHDLWRRSVYHGPFTKKWWQAQQAALDALNAGHIQTSDPAAMRSAILGVCAFAADTSKLSPAPEALDTPDQQP